MEEKRIDRVIRELSECYEFNKRISTYIIKSDKSNLTVETADIQYKISQSSDDE